MRTSTCANLMHFKKYVAVGILVMGVPLSGFSYGTQDQVTQLETQVRKLNNQVQYLITQAQQKSGNNLADTVSDLRGQVEVNRHQISQIQKNSDEKLAALEKKIKALQTSNKTQVQSATKGTMDQKSEALFQKGVTALSAKKYSEASEIFRRYQSNYPVGDHASESMFLRAQIALAVGNPKLAKERFSALLAIYPRSAKAADTYLNLGIISKAMGEKSAAKKYFNKVLKSYPKSSAAAKIRAES